MQLTAFENSMNCLQRMKFAKKDDAKINKIFIKNLKIDDINNFTNNR